MVLKSELSSLFFFFFFFFFGGGGGVHCKTQVVNETKSLIGLETQKPDPKRG